MGMFSGRHKHRGGVAARQRAVALVPDCCLSDLMNNVALMRGPRASGAGGSVSPAEALPSCLRSAKEQFNQRTAAQAHVAKMSQGEPR